MYYTVFLLFRSVIHLIPDMMRRGRKGNEKDGETISFNGSGIFDRQTSNLRDYLTNSIVTNEVDAISGAAPVVSKKGK